jgi:tetratricopeptide (TPR) repeat protein
VDASESELAAAAQAARQASDFLLLERLGRELVVRGESAGNRVTTAWGNYHLGIALASLNRGPEAAEATRIAIALFEQSGERFAAARAMMNLGIAELDINGNALEAQRLFDLSMPVVRELGAPINVGIALGNLGEIYRHQGDFRRALVYAEESLALFRVLDDPHNVVWQLMNVAHYEHRLRRYKSAAAHMGEAHELLRAHPNPRWLAWYFDLWFLFSADLNRLTIAAKLHAFAEKYRTEHVQPRSHAMTMWLSAATERVARDLSTDAYETLVKEGESLTVESAQQLIEEKGTS